MSPAPRIVVAPDKFKGSLTAVEAAGAIARGVSRAAPRAEVVRVPMADGGEGTIDAVVAAGAERRRSTVTGPLGAPVDAEWAVHGDTAIVETAQASGLALVRPDPRTALDTDTFGTGELVRAALDAGVRRIVLGIGGTATTDAGLGALRALGAVFRDARGTKVAGGGRGLADVAAIDVGGLDARLAATEILLCSDVSNPFSGEHGAARVFAPQKGADAAAVDALDRGLSRLSGVLRAATGVDLDALRWGGSGGGIGGTFHALLGAERASGIDLVADLVGLDARLRGADLAIVGEGSLDAQSLLGKTPVGVARRAQASGVAVVAVAGVCDLAPAELQAHGIADLATAAAAAGSAAAALADPATWVSAAAEAVVRRHGPAARGGGCLPRRPVR